MKLIHLILDKYESSKADWNGAFIGHRSYKTDKGYPSKLPKAEFIKEALELEKENLITTKWINGCYHTDLEYIRYSLTDIPVFYEKVNRKPKYEQVKEMVKFLEHIKESVQANWIKDYLDDRIEKAEQGAINQPDEVKEEQEKICACLMQIDQLREPVFRRVFSRKVLHDSKLFENEYKKKIVPIAKKYYREAIDDSMTEKEILKELYIDDYAQELTLKGNIRIKLEGQEGWTNLSSFTYGTVLNAQTLRNIIQIEGSDIKRVISIENKANYLSEPYKDDVLILFSHGYYSPLERQFLKKLKMVLPAATEYYHSGDLDYGGIRIFQYIKQNIFPELKPLNMSTSLFQKYRAEGMLETMKPDTLEKMKQLKEPVLNDLINLICSTGMQMEQENILMKV